MKRKKVAKRKVRLSKFDIISNRLAHLDNQLHTSDGRSMTAQLADLRIQIAALRNEVAVVQEHVKILRNPYWETICKLILDQVRERERQRSDEYLEKKGGLR